MRLRRVKAAIGSVLAAVTLLSMSLTGVTAADLSRIRNADLGRFTIDRLVRILNALDRRVTVKVSKASKPVAA